VADQTLPAPEELAPSYRPADTRAYVPVPSPGELQPTRNRMSPLLALLALLMFFFPFANFNFYGRHIAHFSGVQLMDGLNGEKVLRQAAEFTIPGVLEGHLPGNLAPSELQMQFGFGQRLVWLWVAAGLLSIGCAIGLLAPRTRWASFAALLALLVLCVAGISLNAWLPDGIPFTIGLGYGWWAAALLCFAGAFWGVFGSAGNDMPKKKTLHLDLSKE